MNVLLIVLGYVVCLAILSVGLYQIPNLESIWAIMVMVMLALAGRRSKTWLFIILFSICMVVIPIYGNPSISFLLVTAIPGLAMGLGIRRWQRFSQIIALGFAGAAAGLGIWWMYLDFHGAALGMHWLEQLFAEGFKMVLANPEYNEIYTKQGISKPIMESFLAMLANVRWGLFIYSEWIKVFISLLIVRVMNNSQEQLTIRPFAQQQMAWALDYLIIAAFILILAGGQWNQQWAILLGTNIIFVLAPITVYYGLAVAVYQLSNWKMNFWLIIALTLFVPLLFITPFLLSQFLVFLAVLGIFDPLLDYRNFEHQKEDPK